MLIILVLAIGILLAGVGGYQLAEKHMLAAGKPDLAIESAEPEQVYHNCLASTERMFEMRLVEAEIMGLEDMTMCEDVECKNCKPSRDRIRDIRRRKEREEFAKLQATLTHEQRFQNMLEAHNQPILVSASVPHENMSPRRYPRPPKGNGGGSPSPDALRERKFKELAAKQSAEARNLHRELNGRMVPVPNNVPKRAMVELIYDSQYMCDTLVWSWEDEVDSGKVRVYVQRLAAGFKNTFEPDPRKMVAKPYAKGAIKDLDMLLCPPREAPRIGTERVSK